MCTHAKFSLVSKFFSYYDPVCVELLRVNPTDFSVDTNVLSWYYNVTQMTKTGLFRSHHIWYFIFRALNMNYKNLEMAALYVLMIAVGWGLHRLFIGISQVQFSTFYV